LEKKNEEVEEIKENRRGEFLGVNFFIIQTSHHLGNSKIVLNKSLFEFFKFNLCGYNIFKIKKI